MKSYRIVISAILLACSVVWPQSVTGLKGWTIVVDPGHSQTENMGWGNFSEAERNLQVALALQDLLVTKTDITAVWLTRTNDADYVDLSERSDYANSLGAAWFHSVHSDAPSTTENSTLLLWGQYRDGREKVPNGGKLMSSFITDLLTRGMRTNTRGSWGDCSFYGCTTNGPYLSVNRLSVMPSELSEAGFHTNPAQNMRNMNHQWNRLEAYTLFWSILQFHKLPRPPVSILAGYIADLERGVKLNGATISAAGKSYTTDSYQNLFHKYSSDPEEMHNGFYFLEDLAQDTVEVIISHPEYQPDTLTVALNDTFFTFKDFSLVWNRPPYVASTTPLEGDQRVSRTSQLTFNFSRPLNREKAEAAIEIIPPVKLKYSWSNNYSRLVVTPDTLQVETDYLLRIGPEAVDRYDHPFDGNGDGIAGDEYLFHFRTGPLDMSPPKIAGTFPLNNSQNNDLQPIINILYDEAIDPASVDSSTVRLENASGQAVQGVLEHYTIRKQSLLSFFPAGALAANQYYSFKVQPGLRDNNGNEESAVKTLRFRTGQQNYTYTAIDNFEDGLSNWWAPAASGTTTGTNADSTSVMASAAVVNHLTASSLSMQLNYGWDLSRADWILREYLNSGAPKNVRFDKNKLLQVYVFGDGGGTLFRFAVDDRVPNYVAANHEVSPWFKIDWYGWRQVSWNMASDGTGTWLGDGSLDGTLGFDSIQISYAPGGATSGFLFFDDLRLAEAAGVPVAESENTPASQFSLMQNYPNPFNPTTTISYSVAAPLQPVVLVVYDLLGRRVRKLVDQVQAAGDHHIVWDGRDDAGLPAANGVYLYRITAGADQATRTMVLLK